MYSYKSVSLVELPPLEDGGDSASKSNAWWYHPDDKFDQATCNDNMIKLRHFVSRFSLWLQLGLLVVVVALAVVHHNRRASSSSSSLPAPPDNDINNAMAAQGKEISTREAMRDLLGDGPGRGFGAGLFVTEPEFLVNETSVQHKALVWASQDPIAQRLLPNALRYAEAAFNNVQPTMAATRADMGRLVQRYVLALLYYSLMPPPPPPPPKRPNATTNGAVYSFVNATPRQYELNHAFDETELWLTTQSECNWKGIICHDHQVDDNDGIRVHTINLTKHNLQGRLPYELHRLSDLVHFDVRDNQLTGQLLLLLHNECSCEYVGPNHPPLDGYSGPIDGWVYDDDLNSYFGSFTKLESLLLGNNLFSGPVPSGVSELEHIVEVDLSSNRFTGHIPPRMTFAAAWEGRSVKLEYLKSIRLDHNRLTGTLPASFLQDMPRVEYFDVSHNQLSGPIPLSTMSHRGNNSTTTVEFFHHVKHFHSHNNSLTGTIPPWGNNTTIIQLESLQLFGNKLEGTVPVEFCEIAGLRISVDCETGDISCDCCQCY